MTDEPPTPTPTPEDSAVAKLRDEMAAQFQSLKSSFETQLADLKAQNDTLQAENKELNRALVRSAVSDPPAPADTRTPEEIAEAEYTAEIKKIYEKSIKYQEVM